MTKSACILFLYSFVISTWAYPSGAPPNLVCDTMSVKHDPYESQTSDLPYTVTIDKKTVQPSGVTDITISGKDFKGFFVQVRRGDKAVGSFVTDSEDGEYQAMTCHNNKNSAAIQTNGSVKKLVTLKWKAPQEKGKLQVYVTMVDDFKTFWDKQYVGTITVV